MKISAAPNHLVQIIFLLGSLIIASCTSKPSEDLFADTVILNGSYYTADENYPSIEGLAIHSDTIAAVGSTEQISSMIGPETRVIDASGKFVMPGFIEGHGHFLGLGESLVELNFLEVHNWDTICQMVAEKAQTLPAGTWIYGRGWHQEKLDSLPPDAVRGYPTHRKLSELVPDHPVLLSHASGHGLIANQNAMDIAQVTRETPDPSGGHIVRDAFGNPTGIFEERAEELIDAAYMEALQKRSEEEIEKYLQACVRAAEEDCLKKGVTSFQDAGTKVRDIHWLRDFAAKDSLRVRLWVMVRERYDQLQGKLDGFPWIGLADDHLTVRAIKSEIDGALGAYGAWLLRPYRDKPGFEGQNTTPLTEVKGIAEMAKAGGMQFCVHAIGDRGNRIILDLFETMFEGEKQPSDLRWRIEHAQHLHPDDIPRFSQLGVIAAMQAVHCTSDAPFVVKRLGENRASEGAYAWRSLLDAGAVVTNGTDAPVEDVAPLRSFYASVTRKRPGEDEPFMPHQKISREEALYSYTMANAYAAFEENIKGSLTPGKLADIIILDKDLLNCPEEDILNTHVLVTIVAGQERYVKL